MTDGPQPLLSLRNVVQEFRGRGRGSASARGSIHAVSDVSFDIWPGETVGLVGESGAGKSSLARAVLQLPRPRSGSVRFRDQELTTLEGAQLLESRRQVQLVFQDPFGALNPKWSVAAIVEEPLVGYRLGDASERRRRVTEVLGRVGLPPQTYAKCRPRELSGGQCQRVAIARAIAPNPALVICDEAVSSLDVLVQAQMLRLFEQLRTGLGLSYLFISHDLAVVKQISDRVAVMHAGQLCEIGPTQTVYSRPQHPYTAALLASIPRPDPGTSDFPLNDLVRGDPPSPLNPPSGCRFRTRCSRATDLCAKEPPPLQSVGDEHQVACHFPMR